MPFVVTAPPIGPPDHPIPSLLVSWGPLVEHVVLFAILVTVSTVVYHGLRRENVREILVVGVSRALFFIVVSLLIFGVGGYLVAEWL